MSRIKDGIMVLRLLGFLFSIISFLPNWMRVNGWICVADETGFGSRKICQTAPWAKTSFIDNIMARNCWQQQEFFTRTATNKDTTNITPATRLLLMPLKTNKTRKIEQKRVKIACVYVMCKILINFIGLGRKRKWDSWHSVDFSTSFQYCQLVLPQCGGLYLFWETLFHHGVGNKTNSFFANNQCK